MVLQSVLQAVGPYHFMRLSCCAFVQRLFRLNLTLTLVKTKKAQRPEMSRSPDVSL